MRLLPALFILLGCADAEPVPAPALVATEAVAVAEASAAAPETTASPKASGRSAAPLAVVPATDWTGRYEWSEGAGNYSYGYSLELSTAGPEAPDQYVGVLDVGGTQVATHFDVLGEPTSDGGLDITLIGYREYNTTTIPKPGDRLLTLRWEDAGDMGDEAGDKILRTYWGAVTPTGAGEEAMGAESSLAFYLASTTLG